MGIDNVAQLLNLSTAANNPNDARTKRIEHDCPTKCTGAGNANKAFPDRKANPAKPDGGHKSRPLLRALAQMAERHEAQKKAKEEAKKNRPWRNIPQYYAKQKEKRKHRPARAKTNDVRAYRQRLIRES